MTLSVNVNITTDSSEGSGMHFYSPPGQLFPHAPAPSHEVPTEMAWAPGRSGHHAFAKSVKHRNRPIAQSTHDCGPFICDEAALLPAMANGRIVAMAANSSRKMAFGASTVVMCGVPTGLTTADGGVMPMKSCGEPLSLPFVWSTTSSVNTVLVGATQGDVDGGWRALYVGLAIDLVQAIVILEDPELEAEKAAHRYMFDVAGPFKALWKLSPGMPTKKELVAMAVSGAQSLQKSYQSGWKTPVTVTLGKKTGSASYSFTATYDPTKGSWSFDGGYGVAGRKAKTGVSSGAEGPEVHDPSLHGPNPEAPRGYDWDPERGFVPKSR